MPRLDPTFTDTDILRFLHRNMRQDRLDRVICTILMETGYIGAAKNSREHEQFLKTVLKGPLFLYRSIIIDILDKIANEVHYSADY